MSEEIMQEKMESEQPKEPPCFETRTTYTKDVWWEYHKSLFASLMTMMKIFLPLICVGLLVILLLHDGAWSGEDKLVMFTGAFFILFMPVWWLLMRFNVNTGYRNLIAANKKEPTIYVAYYDAEMMLTNENSGGKETYSYDNVKKIRRTKHLYIITMKPNLNIIVDRSGFLTGDAASFEAFIAEKCPQAKRNF